MLTRIHILLLCISICGTLGAQIPQRSAAADSLRITFPDSLTGQNTSLTYKVSPDSLDAKVDYSANDSMRFDNTRSEWHLYGDASVKYLTLTLMADYIVFNLDSNIALAQGFPDSLGRLSGFPEFSDAGQAFTARKLRYNFKTQKGIIYDARTEQGELIIHGARTKYVGGKDSDSAQVDDHIYNTGALITNCDAEIPHWGIRSSKIKTIPNKLAVIGASHVEIRGVPTPLWLPFGFFPMSPSRRSGLIFPKDYEYSDTWGFGLRDLGYYIPISEHMDAKVLGDIYFNGSWGLSVLSSYRKRYAYNGTINLGFSNRRNEIPGELDIQSQKSFSIRVSHNQDAKAHPYRRLGGSINIQTNDYQSINQNDANSVLTSLYTSNFSWSRTFPGKPYSLSMSLSHSQNTRTKEITIDAPNLDFRINRIYPFKNQNRVGKEKWFEKVGFQYSGNARSKFLTTDSTIFSSQMWQDALYGVQHRANADLNFSALKYFNFTPSVNYEEIWFFKTMEREFIFDPLKDIVYDTFIDPNGIPIIVPDTISFGKVDPHIVSGFTPFRRFSSGISMNTQIFGMMKFRKGWLRGIRHVIKPGVSFSFTPDLFDQFRDSVQTDIRRPDPAGFQDYSILDRGVYSASFSRGDQMALGYSFNNIFEAKYFSRKDSTEKKLKLFDNIVVSGNYNFRAVGDSLHFSPMNINGTTRFFKGASTFGFSAIYDFYDIDANGRRIQKFYWDSPGRLLRFDNFNARISTRMTIQKIRELFSPKPATPPSDPDDEQAARDPRSGAQSRSRQAPDKFFDLFNDFSIDHNLSLVRDGKKDTTMITTHTINMRGSLHISPKWTINVGNIGYDFRSDRLTYPDFGFSRDLHCWFLALSWQPQRGTYSLQIGVKPGTLDFIKIPHNRNTQDTFGGF